MIFAIVGNFQHHYYYNYDYPRAFAFDILEDSLLLLKLHEGKVVCHVSKSGYMSHFEVQSTPAY